jgi:hypothetical protein
MNNDNKLKTEKKNNDNGWTNLKLFKLKRKLVELKIYRYLHREAGSYYKKLHQKLFLPQTTIMTVATGTLFTSLSGKISDEQRYWINFGVSFITLIGSILSIWVKFFNAEQLAFDHLEASKNYSLIIEDIEEELSLDNNEKTIYSEYISKIKKLISDERQKPLEIEQKFWESYFQSVSKGELVRLTDNIIDDEIKRENDLNLINFSNINNYSNLVSNNMAINNDITNNTLENINLENIVLENGDSNISNLSNTPNNLNLIRNENKSLLKNYFQESDTVINIDISSKEKDNQSKENQSKEKENQKRYLYDDKYDSDDLTLSHKLQKYIDENNQNKKKNTQTQKQNQQQVETIMQTQQNQQQNQPQNQKQQQGQNLQINELSENDINIMKKNLKYQLERNL